MPPKRGRKNYLRVKASRIRNEGKISCNQGAFEFQMGEYTRLTRNDTHEEYDARKEAVSRQYTDLPNN